MIEPNGVSDLARFGLGTCFVYTINVKDVILTAFCSFNSCLRVVVATVVLGMGLDCPDV